MSFKNVDCYTIYCFEKSPVIDIPLRICVPQDQEVDISIVLDEIGSPKIFSTHEKKCKNHEEGHLKLFYYDSGEKYYSPKEEVFIYPCYQWTKEKGDQLFFICLSKRTKLFRNENDELDLSKINVNSRCFYTKAKLFFDIKQKK